MAVIGMLDWDLTRWKQPIMFNIDLMKMSYYHKYILRDVVQMEKHYSSDMCAKVYIRKDYEDYEYPGDIVEDTKAEWGGVALQGGQFIPLPEEIERCPADTDIYSGMGKYYQKNSHLKASYNLMIKGQHIRLSRDEKTVYPDWRKQINWELSQEHCQYFFVHDRAVGKIEGALEAIKEIQEHYPKLRIGFKHPVDCTKETMDDWLSFVKISDFCSFVFTDILPESFLEELPQIRQQFILRVDSQSWTKEKFISSLPIFLKQGIFLSSKTVTFLLDVEKNFLEEEEWIDFFRFFNEYMKSCVVFRNRMLHNPFIYCKYCYFRITNTEKTKLFYFIRNQNKQLFDLLYRVEYVTIENGQLVDHAYSQSEYQKKISRWRYLYDKRRDSLPNSEASREAAPNPDRERIYTER